jgi:hypothetical protein
MSSQTRYAIYLAPPPHDPLWQFGSAVLGYDAATGEDVTGFLLAGMDAETWRENSLSARDYGFHATLKAPFRLSPGTSIDHLVTAIEELASSVASVPLGSLAIKVLGGNNEGGFLALAPQSQPPSLFDLERTVVTKLDTFRAPLSPSEIARRKPESLTARQRDYLERFGYPYVLEEFRLHFTLSDRLADAAAMATEMEQRLINQIGLPAFSADALVLFEQASATSRFRIKGRFALTGKN